MNQPETILANGTRIRTHVKLKPFQGWINPAHKNARCSDAEGVIAGVAGGFGGDVYHVKHDGAETTAVYSFDEFELVDEAPPTLPRAS